MEADDSAALHGRRNESRDTAWAMSEENVELVRRAIEANRSGPPAETVERAAELVRLDLEFVSRLTAVEGRSYQGIDGVRAYYADLADAWQEWHNELLEITEIGPNSVLTETVFRGTARSGVDVQLEIGILWELMDGRIIRIHAYPSREEALEAAGLST